MGIILITKVNNMSAKLECTMTGFQTMVSDITNLLLLAITLNVSIIEAILSGMPDLAKAFDLSYKFLKSSSGFAGYVIAAVYYFSEEAGVGNYLCMGMEYGYYIIYYLNIAITFGQNGN